MERRPSMKVMVGEFITESNANIPLRNNLGSFKLMYGDECLEAMHLRDVFEGKGVEAIPAVLADAGASGVIERDAFDYIEGQFVRCAREHIGEIDGMLLMLHGASEVEGLGSGDHHILAAVRGVVGEYLPIFVVCDPHGNMSREYAEATTLIRSYRESPHTDSVSTLRAVAGWLCDFLRERQDIHSVYRKLPLILGGEQSVSTDEPVRSINSYMDEMERDPRVRSASWHVGYIRHDTDVAGCGVVVVPQAATDQGYCERKADELAEYVWERRREFHYTGLTAAPDEALRMALRAPEGPAFITDSGDNVTSGATGWNTYILRQVLGLPAGGLGKRVLFANICDPGAYDRLAAFPDGARTRVSLGVGRDEMSLPVELDVTVKSRGPLRGYLHHPHDEVYGYAVVVGVDGLPVDVAVASTRQTMCERHQFEAVGLSWDDYDVTVVKQGYIFPELKEAAKFSVMSLTGGATPQDTRIIPFKRIMRPMFPIDDI